VLMQLRDMEFVQLIFCCRKTNKMFCNDYMMLLIVLAPIILLYPTTGMFLSALDREKPELYRRIATMDALHGTTLGPVRFGLLYIVPLNYERWELSSKTRWLGRILFAAYLFEFLLVGLFLLCLLDIGGLARQ